jgi:acetate kinase
MLIFEPGFSGIQWWRSRGEGDVEKGFSSATDEMIALIDNQEEAVAYVLPNGGAVFTEEMIRVSPESVSWAELAVPIYRDPNQRIVDLAKIGFSTRPSLAQVWLCDTAFFCGLPLYARAFALPWEYFNLGIMRFGGDGFFHRWAWEVSRSLRNPGKIVSLHLGDTPNAAAIQSGSQPRVIETSFGFSPLASIPSRTGSGEIDPNAILLLLHEGWEVKEVESMVTQQSGIRALLGSPGGWNDVMEMAGKGVERAVMAYRILLQQAVKSVGSCLAALGGAEVILIAGEEIDRSSKFVDVVRQRLEFTKIKIEVLDYDRGAELEKTIRNFIQHLPS